MQLKKRADAPVMLTLVRRDGSATSGAIGPAAGYGPVHDLAHYVVEQTLGLADAFLGLVAAGWSMKAFERNAAARVPDAAVWAECWAGELSRQVHAGQRLSAPHFNATIAAAVARTRPEAPAPPVAAETLDAWWSHLERLCAAWAALPIGGTLSCPFEPGVPAIPAVSSDGRPDAPDP